MVKIGSLNNELVTLFSKFEEIFMRNFKKQFYATSFDLVKQVTNILFSEFQRKIFCFQ